jgi:hypothetical protein
MANPWVDVAWKWMSIVLSFDEDFRVVEVILLLPMVATKDRDDDARCHHSCDDTIEEYHVDLEQFQKRT